MNTLPTERDLPPAARDATRARLVAAADRPPASARPWVPVAAAAGLAAVVGASVAGVAAYRSDPAPAPVGTASPTGLDRAGLAARCIGSGSREVDTSGSRLLVLFRDRQGYQFDVGNAGFIATCAASPDGREVFRGGSVGIGGQDGDNLTYFDKPWSVQLDTWGSQDLNGGFLNPGDPVVFHASGRVSRNVTRVVITWPGHAPVTAAVEGPRFLARVPGVPPVEGQEPPDRPDMIVAYDAAGRVVGRTN
jgi:hypothetical protein